MHRQFSTNFQGTEKPLGLAQLVTAFRFYGMGIGMSVLIFVMEKAQLIGFKFKHGTQIHAWQ